MALDDALLRRLARSSGLRANEVRQLVQFQVVTVSGEALQPTLMRRLRRARRLRRDLGLSLDAVVIVMRLLDRIDELEGARRQPGRVRVLDDLRAR